MSFLGPFSGGEAEREDEVGELWVVDVAKSPKHGKWRQDKRCKSKTSSGILLNSSCRCHLKSSRRTVSDESIASEDSSMWARQDKYAVDHHRQYSNGNSTTSSSNDEDGRSPLFLGGLGCDLDYCYSYNYNHPSHIYHDTYESLDSVGESFLELDYMFSPDRLGGHEDRFEDMDMACSTNGSSSECNSLLDSLAGLGTSGCMSTWSLCRDPPPENRYAKSGKVSLSSLSTSEEGEGSKGILGTSEDVRELEADKLTRSDGLDTLSESELQPGSLQTQKQQSAKGSSLEQQLCAANLSEAKGRESGHSNTIQHCIPSATQLIGTAQDPSKPTPAAIQAGALSADHHHHTTREQEEQKQRKSSRRSGSHGRKMSKGESSNSGLTLDLSSLPQPPSSWAYQQHQQQLEGGPYPAAALSSGDCQHFQQQQQQQRNNIQHHHVQQSEQQQQQPQQHQLSPYSQLQQSIQSFQQHYLATSPPVQQTHANTFPSSFSGTGSFAHIVNNEGSRSYDGSNHHSTSSSSSFAPPPSRPVTSVSASSSASSSRPPSAVSHHSYNSNTSHHSGHSSGHSSGQQQPHPGSSGSGTSDWLTSSSAFGYNSNQQAQTSQQPQYQSQHVYHHQAHSYSQAPSQSHPHQHNYEQQQTVEKPPQPEPKRTSGIFAPGQTTPALYDYSIPHSVSPSPYQASSYWHPANVGGNADGQQGASTSSNFPGLHINTGVSPGTMTVGNNSVNHQDQQQSSSLTEQNNSSSLYQEPTSPYLASPSSTGPQSFYSSSLSQLDNTHSGSHANNDNVYPSYTQSNGRSDQMQGLVQQQSRYSDYNADQPSSSAAPSYFNSTAPNGFQHNDQINGQGSAASGGQASHLSHLPLLSSTFTSSDFDMAFDNIPLHFDYSKPGDPQPISKLPPTQPKRQSLGHRSSHSSSSFSRSSSSRRGHTLRTISQGSSGSNASLGLDQQGQATSASAAAIAGSTGATSDSDDSGGSNFFSKGQKRRRPGGNSSSASATTPSSGQQGSVDGSLSAFDNASGTSNMSQFGSQNQTGQKENAYHAAPPLPNGHQPDGSSSNINNTFMQGYHEALPQMSALHLNGTTLIQPQPQPYPFTTGGAGQTQTAVTSKRSVATYEEPPSPSEADAVDGMDLRNEKDDGGMRTTTSSSGRRLYECKICSRSKSYPLYPLISASLFWEERNLMLSWCDFPRIPSTFSVDGTRTYTFG